MVQTGTVSVNVASGASSQSSQITVNPRQGWTTSPVAAVPGSVPECPTFVSPPPDTSATLGCSTYTVNWPEVPEPAVISSGPNAGFAYFTSQPTFTQNFPWEIHPDVNDLTSEFSQRQYGSCEFISGLQLKTNVVWHESSPEPRSHYAKYKDALQLENYGVYIEQRVATPGANPAQFHQFTNQQLTARANNIINWAKTEDFLCTEPNMEQVYCESLGWINYPVPYGYRTCP